MSVNVKRSADKPLVEKILKDEKDDAFNRASYLYEKKHNEHQTLSSFIVKPLLNLIMSIAFTIIILLVFIKADGTSLDYTLAGMKLPTLVSLLLNIYVIFVGSGIAMAVAEYKWVKFQSGAPLTVAEVYDSCTRGLSGMLTAMKASYFDFILVPALMLNIVLLVVAPVSQEMLVPFSHTFNYSSFVSTYTFFNSPYLIDDRTPLASLPIPPTLDGLTYESYLIAQSFSSAATDTPMFIPYTCPGGVDYCLYKNTSFISTTLDCSPTHGQEHIVNQTNYKEITTPEKFFSEFYPYQSIDVPVFFYAGEMLGRTHSDLKNYTAPTVPFFGPKGFIFDDYDPQYRPYVGNQTFIVAYSNVNYRHRKENSTSISFSKCTFHSSLNTTDWITKNGTLVKHGIERSTPILLDFDHVLGNNTALFRASKDTSKAPPDHITMVNAYIMQQAILNELVLHQYRPLLMYLKTWSKDYSASVGLFEFLKQGLFYFDLNFAIFPYVTSDYSRYKTGGTVVVTEGPTYLVKKSNCYILFTLLLLPILWWFSVWIFSMKKTNGIARGSSQIALISMEMTPLASKRLGTLSGINNETAFKKAKNIRVRMGAFADTNEKKIMVGLEDETTYERLDKVKTMPF